MSKPFSLIARFWLLITIFNLLIITVLSLTPLDKLPPVPGTDKIHHFIAYSVLMFPAALKRPHKWILIAVVFTLYSGMIELIQPYVNRYCDWMDIAANSAGIIVGIILAIFIRSYITLK